MKGNWAENECRIACKRENPSYDFDSDKFDYGCSCYKSALKAYNSLMEDEHSGFSWNATARILERLINNLPLTPITDDDFMTSEQGVTIPLESPEYLREHGMKSNLQCPRLSSLFREETLDGQVSYHDVDRAYAIDIESPSETFHTSMGFLDEMFPITMPYMPTKEKYKVYMRTFLSDTANGDFDTREVVYMVTPSGERIDINKYYGEKGRKWVELTKEEYEERLSHRIDKLNEKIADHLIWTLISNSASDDEIERRDTLYKSLDQDTKDKYFNELSELCKFFDDPDHYRYNTFSMRQSLCTGDEEHYKDIPELVTIAEYLRGILSDTMGLMRENIAD